MKNLTLAILFMLSGTANAATTSNTERTLLKAGHDYISENADMGGRMDPNSCRPMGPSSGTSFIEACSGEYHFLGPGGGGDFKASFTCTATFTAISGQPGFYSYQPIDCQDVN